MSLREEIVNIIADCDPWEGHMDYDDRNKAANRIIRIIEKRIDELLNQRNKYHKETETRFSLHSKTYSEIRIQTLNEIKEMLK